MFEDKYIMKHFYNEFPPINDIKLAGGFTWKELAIKMGVTEMCLWRWNRAGAHIPLHQRVQFKEILDKCGSTIINREDSICAKIDKHAKICITCKNYVEHRVPELVEEHGEYTGFCNISKELLTVNADSTCNRVELLFD